MRTLVFAASLVALASVPTVAGAQSDIISELLDHGNTLYTSQGYQPSGWEHRGSLKTGELAQIDVNLTGGSQYELMGICDLGCEDLDMALLDSNGDGVDVDKEDDDVPIVSAKGSGHYTLGVKMVKCKTDRCRYGVRAFVK